MLANIYDENEHYATQALLLGDILRRGGQVLSLKFMGLATGTEALGFYNPLNNRVDVYEITYRGNDQQIYTTEARVDPGGEITYGQTTGLRALDDLSPAPAVDLAELTTEALADKRQD